MDALLSQRPTPVDVQPVPSESQKVADDLPIPEIYIQLNQDRSSEVLKADEVEPMPDTLQRIVKVQFIQSDNLMMNTNQKSTEFNDKYKRPFESEMGIINQVLPLSVKPIAEPNGQPIEVLPIPSSIPKSEEVQHILSINQTPIEVRLTAARYKNPIAVGLNNMYVEKPIEPGTDENPIKMEPKPETDEQPIEFVPKSETDENPIEASAGPITVTDQKPIEFEVRLNIPSMDNQQDVTDNNEETTVESDVTVVEYSKEVSNGTSNIAESERDGMNQDDQFNVSSDNLNNLFFLNKIIMGGYRRQ